MSTRTVAYHGGVDLASLAHEKLNQESLNAVPLDGENLATLDLASMKRAGKQPPMPDAISKSYYKQVMVKEIEDTQLMNEGTRRMWRPVFLANVVLLLFVGVGAILGSFLVGFRPAGAIYDRIFTMDYGVGAAVVGGVAVDAIVTAVGTVWKLSWIVLASLWLNFVLRLVFLFPSIQEWNIRYIVKRIINIWRYIAHAASGVLINVILYTFFGASNLTLVIAGICLHLIWRFSVWAFAYHNHQWLDEWFGHKQSSDPYFSTAASQTNPTNKDAKWLPFILPGLFAFLADWAILSVFAIDGFIQGTGNGWDKWTLFFVCTALHVVDYGLEIFRFFNNNDCCSRGLRDPWVFEVTQDTLNTVYHVFIAALILANGAWPLN